MTSKTEVEEFLKTHPDKVYLNLVGPYAFLYGAYYSSIRDAFYFVSSGIKIKLRDYNRIGKWTFNKGLTKRWENA